MPELMVEIRGKPEDVKAMIAISHKAGAKTTRKRRIDANYYQLWFIGDPGDEGDFMRALKHRAGLAKPRRTGRSKGEDAGPIDEAEETPETGL